MSDIAITAGRVVLKLVEHLDADGRRAAAADLRTMDGDTIERQFFTGVAQAIDDLVAAEAAEGGA